MTKGIQEGINVLYSGELGEVRYSNFLNFKKGFSKKSGFSIKYVLSGQENYTFENEQVSLSSGQALFLKQENFYQCVIDSPIVTSGVCVDLNLEQLSGGAADPLNEHEGFFFHPEFNTQRISFLDNNLRNSILGIVAGDNSGNSLFFQEFLTELMLNIMHLEVRFSKQIQSVPVKKTAYQKELFRRLLLAKNFIHDQRHDRITLQSISRVSCLSPFYLNRLFSQVFGISPSSYLEQLRMKEAQQELRNGLSVKEVGYQIGYSDESYFCRRFKKFFGKTPKQFQREQRQ